MKGFEGLSNLDSIFYQIRKWVKGIPLHNPVRNECCPDFSCCNSNLLTPKSARIEILSKEQSAMLNRLQQSTNRSEIKKICNSLWLITAIVLEDTNFVDTGTRTDVLPPPPTEPGFYLWSKGSNKWILANLQPFGYRKTNSNSLQPIFDLEEIPQPGFIRNPRKS